MCKVSCVRVLIAMEDIVGRWKSLSISEEEGEIVGIDDEIIQEGEKEAWCGILGKVLTKRPLRKSSFRGAIARLWKVEGGFTMRELENDVFLFLFSDAKERRRILDMEPWVFDKHLIVLKEVNGDDVLNWGDWCFTPFWVQAHNLPMRGIGEKIGMMIGEATGVAIRVWKDKDGMCTGSFIRIRVLVDVSKPIRRVVPVRLGSSGAVHWAELKFERIPDFCYVCGHMDHIATECQDSAAEAMIEANKYQYGDWLIASRFSTTGGGGVAGFQKDVRSKRLVHGDGIFATSGLKIPAGQSEFPNQGHDSQAAKSRESRPKNGDVGCSPEASVGKDSNKFSPPNAETLTPTLVDVVVNNSKGNSLNVAREEQETPKGQLEEAREQVHADLKVPIFQYLAGHIAKHARKKAKGGSRKSVAAQQPSGMDSVGLGGSKRKLVGDLVLGVRKRMALGDISNTGISAEVAEQPRREI